MTQEQFFAVVEPGLETFAAGELKSLGLLSSPVRNAQTTGGVAFQGDMRALYRANLHLHCASRVLVSLGKFYAAAFSELHKKAARLSWESYLHPGQPVAVRVTCHKSRLYHSGAVAERVVKAIGDRLGRVLQVVKPGDEEADMPAQLVVVRLVRDRCTIRVDSSGALLHRRGYRLATAKAPLRETLAAGMLLASGWDRRAPLLDPFCGSGTIPIEAARMAAGISPGSGRRFAFMDWPHFQADLWEGLFAEAKSAEDLSRIPPILASDRDAGAVASAQDNAGRAGVGDLIQFSQRAVSAIDPPARGMGWVVTNPPYGVRVSKRKDLRNLYAQIGHVLLEKCPGWQAAILCSDIALLGHSGLGLDISLALVNGGVRVRLGRGRIGGEAE